MRKRKASAGLKTYWRTVHEIQKRTGATSKQARTAWHALKEKYGKVTSATVAKHPRITAQAVRGKRKPTVKPKARKEEKAPTQAGAGEIGAGAGAGAVFTPPPAGAVPEEFEEFIGEDFGPIDSDEEEAY